MDKDTTAALNVHTPPLYGLMIVSHRLLRYASPFLHVVALLAALALSRRRLYRAAAAAQAISI